MTAPTGTVPSHQRLETWEITTPGRVWLKKTTMSRHNQPIMQDVSFGPNRPGHRIQITAADREMNQEACVTIEGDPFRNGLLVRVDEDQNLDPDTETDQAFTGKQLLDIYALDFPDFQVKVSALQEIAIRRLREVAEAVDASMKQVQFLDELIEDRYRNAASQPDSIFDLNGERREDLEARQQN